jgi:hypothetical protein
MRRMIEHPYQASCVKRLDIEMDSQLISVSFALEIILNISTLRRGMEYNAASSPPEIQVSEFYITVGA